MGFLNSMRRHLPGSPKQLTLDLGGAEKANILERIAASTPVQRYSEAVTPVAQNAQNKLVALLDDRVRGDQMLQGPMSPRARMAASPEMLRVLQALPAAGGVGIAVAGANALAGPSEEEIIRQYLAERGMV